MIKYKTRAHRSCFLLDFYIRQIKFSSFFPCFDFLLLLLVWFAAIQSRAVFIRFKYVHKICMCCTSYGLFFLFPYADLIQQKQKQRAR